MKSKKMCLGNEIMMSIIIHESENKNKKKKKQQIFWLTRGICSRKCASHCWSAFKFIFLILIYTEYLITCRSLSTASLFIVMSCLVNFFFFIPKFDPFDCLRVNIRSKSLNRWEHSDGSLCWKVSYSITHHILRHILLFTQYKINCQRFTSILYTETGSLKVFQIQMNIRRIGIKIIQFNTHYRIVHIWN